MLKENIIDKFRQIFAAIPAEQQNALAAELAKMIPADENADVDWSVGSGYDTNKDEVDVGVSLKIAPAKQTLQVMTLIDLVANAVNMGKESQLLDLEDALDTVLAHIIANRKMIHTPALGLTETIFAIRLRFWGEPSEEAKVYGAQKRKEMKPQQETACL